MAVHKSFCACEACHSRGFAILRRSAEHTGRLFRDKRSISRCNKTVPKNPGLGSGFYARRAIATRISMATAKPSTIGVRIALIIGSS
jgi:hypothetical protein